MRSVLRLADVAALLALVFHGCAIKPRPEPPPGEEPAVDLDKINLAFPGGPAPIWVAGGPGAASPPGARLRAYNLDLAANPHETIIQDDGSFSFFVTGESGDEVRLQVLSDSKRSKPIDFILDDPPTQSTRALDCLTLSPALELDLNTSSSLRITNDCPFDVRVEPPSLRRPVIGVAIGTNESWPIDLAPSAFATVSVTVTTPDPFEEIAFISASSPSPDRYPVTLWKR